MSTPPPIACTLGEAEIPARRAQMADLARDVVAAEAHGARAVLRLRRGARTRDRLAAFVDAESRCCAFLRMELRDEPGALTLTIEGPANAEPIVRDLVAELSATRAP